MKSNTEKIRENRISFIAVFKELVSTSKDDKETKLDEEIKKEKSNEDTENIRRLEAAMTPTIKTAKSNTNNLKEKVQNRQGKNKGVKTLEVNERTVNDDNDLIL